MLCPQLWDRDNWRRFPRVGGCHGVRSEARGKERAVQKHLRGSEDPQDQENSKTPWPVTASRNFSWLTEPAQLSLCHFLPWFPPWHPSRKFPAVRTPFPRIALAHALVWPSVEPDHKKRVRLIPLVLRKSPHMTGTSPDWLQMVSCCPVCNLLSCCQKHTPPNSLLEFTSSTNCPSRNVDTPIPNQGLRCF